MNDLISKARFIALGLSVAFIPFSIRICHWSLFLFAVICLFEGNFAAKGKVIVQNPLAWILPSFFLLHLAGVFYSANLPNAWMVLDKKIAFVLAPLIIVSANPFTKREIQRLAWLFIISCFVGTVICFANAIVLSQSGQPLWNFGPQQPYLALHPESSILWPYFSYTGLASGIDIHPTYFALYLYVCVLMLWKFLTTGNTEKSPRSAEATYAKGMQRRISILLTGYFLIFIVLLSSRIIVLMSILTILAAVTLPGIKKSWMTGAAALILIGGTLMINPVAQYRNTQEYRKSSFSWPPAAVSDNPISIRTSLWWLSLNVIGDVNPLFGTGVGDVNDTMIASADKYDVHNVLNTSDPHNQYLHTFISLGAAGLIWLLVVFAAPLRILFRHKEFLACAGLISFMCVCMTESALELQKGIILFALFISLTGNVAREWRFSTQRPEYA